jgi:hypothetical protein
MRRISALVLVSVSLIAVSLACSKDPPPPQPVAPSAQPTYTAPPPTGTVMQPGTPTTPAPGQMSTPGPAALACQNDSQCMTHRCNTQFGKCAFPCQTDADCIQGTTCFVAGGPAAACFPKPPGSQ